MTILRAMQILASYLQHYHPDLDGKVFIANAAEEPKSGQDESVIITLIKVDEEATLKNGPHTRLDSFNKTEHKNRPVFANVYLLFSSVHTNYSTALGALGLVMEFFQSKRSFTHLDGEPGENETESYRLQVDLENLSLEQINHIWGFLGGKQKPSVLYRLRIIPVEAKDKVIARGEPILQVSIETGQ